MKMEAHSAHHTELRRTSYIPSTTATAAAVRGGKRKALYAIFSTAPPQTATHHTPADPLEEDEEGVEEKEIVCDVPSVIRTDNRRHLF